MPELLRPEKFCTHTGGITMTDREVQCADCGAEMVWVTKAYLRGLTIAPTERERELQRSLNVKSAALLRIRQYLNEMGY